MGSIFSELFNNWVNAFEQEEGKKKPIYLPNAKENYRETAKYQMIPSATKDFMSSFGQTQSFFTYFSFSPCVMHPDLRPSDRVLSKHPFLLLRFFLQNH